MKKLFSVLLIAMFAVLTTASTAFSDQYTIIQITDNNHDDFNPNINDKGHIIWTGYDGNDTEVFLYDGSTVTQLTENEYRDEAFMINNSGQITWQGVVGNEDNEIFFYDGSTIIQLTDNSYHDTNPQLSDNGIVVWTGYDGSDNELFMATRNLSSPPIADAGPNQNIILGQTVTFDGSQSYDPDEGDTMDYEWDFGDGNVGLEETVSYIYSAAGEYEVPLTVTDDDGETSADSVLVTVKTHAEVIQDLILDVQDLSLARGLENSLVSKLENAIKFLDKGQTKAVKNKLNAFVNQIEAQRGKKISAEGADVLIENATNLINVL